MMIIKGVVVNGRNLGHKLGFPTANITLDTQLDIENGVYLSRVMLRGAQYKAISNVGCKPTVGGAQKGLECHILDFDGDIYGEQIEVELLTKLRDEVHFASIEALTEQIKLDIEQVKNLNIK